MTKPRLPQTPAEWQRAVDGSEACLGISSARQYGLITGGPEIDVDRCEEIIRLGRERGVTPTEAGVRQAIEAIISCSRKSRPV